MSTEARHINPARGWAYRLVAMADAGHRVSYLPLKMALEVVAKSEREARGTRSADTLDVDVESGKVL